MSVTEGNSGTIGATFDVTLSAPSGRAVSAVYETFEDSASGADFVSQAAILDFPAGETSQTVTVQVNGDVLDEANETFDLRLSGPSTRTLGDAEASGRSPTTTRRRHCRWVTSPSPKATREPWRQPSRWASARSAARTSRSRTPRQMALPSLRPTTRGPAGRSTFPAGDTSRTVTVLVNGDLLDEVDESFLLNLTGPTNATLADGQGAGTITDDDPTPTLSIDDVTELEGDTAARTPPSRSA